MSAVPSDAPRLVAVFWMPPTSGARSSGRDETVTAPSCEASAPIPAPISSSGTVTIAAVAPGLSAGDEDRGPGHDQEQADARDAPGAALGRTLGIPTAITSSEIDSGTSRIPVSIADSSSTTDRNSGIVKKIPDCRKNWKPNSVRPPVELPDAQDRRRQQRLAAVLLEAVAPQQERPQEQQAARDQPDDRRRPREGRRVRLGLDQAPLAGLEDPEHEQRHAARGQHGADDVDPRALGRRRRLRDPADRDEDDDDDDDLAREHPAPGRVGRERPADQRSDGHGDRPGRRDEAVRRRAARRAARWRRRAPRSRAGSARRRCPRAATSRTAAP